MRGSGLSLERFIKGKSQRTKSDAKSKKKVIIHKAQRQREYAKVKKREGSALARDSAAGSSFYDRFFSALQSGVADGDAEGEEEEEVCCLCAAAVVVSFVAHERVAGSGGSSSRR